MFNVEAIIVLVSLTVIVKSNDIRLGFATPQSRKVFSEINEADPALWKRTDDVIVNAPANEVISSVVVTDLRDDKDGEAYIESGGVGDKSVTIALKSPTILRGYKFEIEVYTNNPLDRLYTKGGYTSYSADIQYPRKY